jgi:transposase-like protein
MSDTLVDRVTGDSRGARWIKAHLDYSEPDWCLYWPFSKNENGYGLFGERSTKVHRIMCEYRNGPAPESQPEAAHSCGNGHLGCVNPMHLSWKSRSENLKEMYQHGRKPMRYKLTPAKVDEIRALKDRARPDEIARQFGVTQSTIREIHAGRIWKHDRKDHRIFTEDEVRTVLATSSDPKSAARLSKEYGVSINTIYRIRSRQSYGWMEL